MANRALEGGPNGRLPWWGTCWYGRTGEAGTSRGLRPGELRPPAPGRMVVGGPYGVSMGRSDDDDAWPRADCEVRGAVRGRCSGVILSLHPSPSPSASSRCRSSSTSSQGGGEPEPS